METNEKMNQNSDEENRKMESMLKGANDNKNGGDDSKELARLSKLVSTLELIVEEAKAWKESLEETNCIDQVAKNEPSSTGAATIVSTKASLEIKTTSCAELKDKERLLRAEWIRIITELRRDLENLDASESDATQKEDETYMSDQSTLGEKDLQTDNKDKKIEDLQDDLESFRKKLMFTENELKNENVSKDQKIEGLEKELGSLMITKNELKNENVSKDKKIESLEKELGSLMITKNELKNENVSKDKKIESLEKELGSLMITKKELKNENVSKDQKIEGLEKDLGKLMITEKVMKAENVTKDKKIEELEERIELVKDNASSALNNLNKIEKEWADFQTQKRAMNFTLESKETTITKVTEELSELREAFKKQEEDLAAKDEIIKEHEQSCIGPKGAITGDELGTLMGSLVATTAYNVSYSNKDLPRILIGNSLANLAGSIFGSMCNNLVVHISQPRVENKGFYGTFSIIMKSIFWMLLGGIIPTLARGFTMNYWLRFGLTTGFSFVMQCGSVMLWKFSHKIHVLKAIGIVVLSVIGIGLAAGIPHFLQGPNKPDNLDCGGLKCLA